MKLKVFRALAPEQEKEVYLKLVGTPRGVQLVACDKNGLKSDPPILFISFNGIYRFPHSGMGELFALDEEGRIADFSDGFRKKNY